MATATAKKKVVETIEGVTLELSKREAEFLLHVFGCIAGRAFWNDSSDGDGGGGPGSRIYYALHDAGVREVTDVEKAYAAFNFKSGK